MEIASLILSIIAMIIAPIAAVIIGQFLQNKASIRKDKLSIFQTLLTYRVYGWGSNYAAVNAINSIPIIFHADKEVINKFNIYINSVTIKKEDIEVKRTEIKNNGTKLLQSMSKVLGYNLEFDNIQDPYLPSGIVEDMEKQEKFKEIQLGLGDLINAFVPKKSNETTNISKESQDERKDK